MPRFQPIRWTKSQVERLERAVNDYNDAIDDATADYAQGGAAFLLPKKTTVAEQIDRIDTASALNVVVNSLNRIHRPGALDIDVEHQMTNYEWHEGKVALAAVNRFRMTRLKALGGRVELAKDRMYRPADSYTRRLIDELSLMPFSPGAEYTREKIATLQTMSVGYSGGNRSKLLDYFNNYLRAWDRMYEGVDPWHQRVRQIVLDVMLQPTEVLHDVMYTYDEYGTFDYLYDKYDRTPIERKAQNVLGYWQSIKSKWGF